MTAKPDYYKGTVQLVWVQFNNAVRLQDYRGSLITKNEYLSVDASDGPWTIEMLTGGRVRIWHASRYREGHECRVSTVGPENIASWHAKGDVIQKSEQPQTAA